MMENKVVIRFVPVEVRELKATRQKSYGKRAYVGTDTNGNHVLYSYGTPVLYIPAHGNVVRLWDGYSATTMKHIREICPWIGKAIWEAMPVARHDIMRQY